MSWDKMMADLILTLLPVLSTVVAYVLIIIARYMLNQTNNLEAKAALTNLEQVILSTVTALSQMIVDDLKRSNANGKLTEVEAKLIKDKALASIHNQVASQDMRILEKGFSDIDELIENILEQKVAENKLKKIIAERGCASS